MLQSVRKYTQGWVATIMGIILSFAFIFWGIENYLSGSSKKNIIAKVNGREINASQLNNDFQRMIMQLKEQTGTNFNLPPLMQQELKAQALNNLITGSVLEQAALKSGFRVTPQETSQMIKQMPIFQENGSFRKERFEQTMGRLGYSQQEFFSDIAKNILLNQAASGIIGSAFILPNELDQAIALVEQKRDFDYVIISSSSFKKDVKITPEEIKVYYLQHKAQFKIPAQLQIEYVQLTTHDLKTAIQVTEQDLNEYFNANTEMDRKNGKAIEKAQEAIRQQKVEQAFLAASDKLSDLAFTSPNTLASAADALNLPIHSSEYFSQEGGNTAITKNPKVIAAAFNPDFLKERTNSNLIELAPGNMVVLRIKDYRSETTAPLEQVQDKIKHVLIERKTAAMAKEKVKALVEQIKSKDDFKKLASAEHLTLVTKQAISRHEKSISSDILKVAFSASPTSSRPVALQLANGDCVVINVNKSINFNVNGITDEQRSLMTKLYSDTYGKLDYNLYVENQINKAKIKTYQEK